MWGSWNYIYINLYIYLKVQVRYIVNLIIIDLIWIIRKNGAEPNRDLICKSSKTTVEVLLFAVHKCDENNIISNDTSIINKIHVI